MKIQTHSDRIVIGKVLKTRGVQGEVKVLPLTDIPDRFERLDSVYIEIVPGQGRRVKIERVLYYKDFVYLQFSGYDSINDVQQFLGASLLVERSESPQLPDDVYYHYEIIDADVYTDEEHHLGKVVDILETGSHDVYVVRDKTREYLIPSTKEVVTEIDREKKRITVHPLDGLLDL